MTIYFPDIASFQTGISLENALAVLCKATEGTGYINPDYAAARQRATASGAYFCAYHFLRAGNAAAQAQYAYGAVGKVPLMLDFEPEPQAGSFPTIADAETFTDAYRKAGGVVHLLYLPRWYWQQLGEPSLAPFAQRDMALVSSDYTTYTDADTGAGWQPYGGMTPAVWQYTDALQFAGMTVDFNAFRGSYAGKQDPASVTACLAEFRQLVTTGSYGQQPAAPDAYRHMVPAGNTLSLDALAAQRHTTADFIAGVTRKYVNAQNLAVLNAYLVLDAALTAAGQPHPAMPEGMVWWSVNP